MQADFAVEVGADTQSLELPWASADGGVRYLDLRARPELLLELKEAAENHDLAEFLITVNASPSIFQSAKCDLWTSDKMDEEDAVFGAQWKYGSYVDLLLASGEQRLSFDWHERFVRELCGLLRKAPEFAAAVEFVVRRCHFHVESDEDSQPGFCVTFYLYGYGDDESEARSRWNVGIKVVQNALVQWSAQHQRHT